MDVGLGNRSDILVHPDAGGAQEPPAAAQEHFISQVVGTTSDKEVGSRSLRPHESPVTVFLDR